MRLNQDPLDILTQYWGYTSFRAPQEEIIRSALKGKDSLALLPTGGGKSICFQVPGLVMGGLTLVISPLIALMKDQVENLNRKGIPATYINSSLAFHQIDYKLDQAVKGTYRFLYLAPERLQNDLFQTRLRQMPVSLLAVDEAHCISQWGYDFRPSYLHIHQIREIFPDLPIMALTASATDKVQEDIAQKLELKAPEVFRKSFKRDNLRYFVLQEENVEGKIVEIAQRVKGSGIIYARTRKRTTHLAKILQGHGISAGFYHGGMTYSERDEVQQEWISGKLRVIVATNAFGMGIDKGNVRFVLHYNLPSDLESYYQEAGRGGRDGDTSLSIAFNNPIDIHELRRWCRDKYPTWDQVQEHFDGICTHLRLPVNVVVHTATEVDISEMAQAMETRPLTLYRTLNLLHREGILHFHEGKDDFGYLRITATPESVLQYKTQHPASERLINFLLRTLGGTVYTEEQKFLPNDWARMLNYDKAELLALLKRLEAHHLISFIPPKGNPTLQVLGMRRKLRKDEVNWEKYTFLKAQMEFRLQEMLSYVQQSTQCRSLFIQHYFGESDHSPCGKCDVCIGRNKTKVSDNEFQTIQKALVQYIHLHPQISYRSILMEVQVGSPPQREKVLRYLLDKQVIQIASNGNLSMTK